MYLAFVYLFACVLMTNCQTYTYDTRCNQDLQCNKVENASCCLISKWTVIKNILKSLEMQRLLFEPNVNIFFLPNIGNTFPNLTVYIAKECAILMIDRKNFVGLKNLKILDLSANLITALQNSPFDDLVSLEKISLSMNFIKVIDIGIFDKSPGLINVDLTSNKCINIDYDEQAWKDWKHILHLKCQRADGIERIDLKMFNKPCANKNSYHTFGGIMVGGAPRQMDGLAALYYRTSSAITGRFFCAANMITFYHLLTAAHCIQPKYKNLTLKPENIVAVVGQTYLTEQLNSTKSAYEISAITVHPNWNSSETKYTGDIAILTTATRLFRLGIRRVHITRSNEINKYDFGLVAGWGDGQAGPPYEGVMRTVNITAVSSEECFVNDHKLGEIFARKMFCAGGQGEGPCAGASGGGFFVRVNDDWFLRGIVSSATLKNDLSCDVNRYTLYTRVSDYADWIEEVVEKSCDQAKT